MEATIEVTDKLVGSWWVALGDSDWLCGVSEIEPDNKYKVNYRFRYYKDDKVFDESQDTKSRYSMTVTGTRSFVIATIRAISNMLSKTAKEQYPNLGDVDETLMENGDVEAFAKKLMDKPWTFARLVTNEEAEKYGKSA